MNVRRCCPPTVALTLALAVLLAPGAIGRSTQPLAAPGDAAPLALAPVLTGLNHPTFVTHAGDGSGRLFVLERAGQVRVSSGGQLQAEPFLDISELVGTDDEGASEQGLLGLAFDPGYAQNGYFYVYFTAEDWANTLMRFRVSIDPIQADAGSGHVIFAYPDREPNHNGGMLAFGPDGYLYVALGDEGGRDDQYGNAQSLDTPFGKLLRLDVADGTAGIPPDNPFAGDANARPEIWAFGLRNPWRFSFDRVTGDLWIADVGQGNYEEVNLQAASSAGGENYGWNAMEGMHCFDGGPCNPSAYVEPVAEYPHESEDGDDVGCSISGGYVYRGDASPDLLGRYYFGDYCSGRIWSLRPDGAGWAMAEELDTTLGISSFGEDEAGEVYVVDLDGGGIYRLVGAGAAQQRNWARTDQPVAEQRVSRTWMWGPESFSGPLVEQYAQAPSGLREVRYFDKSRMEVTQPAAQDDGIWFVTNGLLSTELITGRMQLGDNQFVQRTPAALNVAGDEDDPGGPTYATFGALLTAPPLADNTPVIQRLSRNGNVSADPSLAARGVTAAAHVQVPGIDHQVASPFWAFMQSSGLVYADGSYVEAALFVNPFYATGYPITEAYWTTVRVGGTPRDVLVQCFERRCLTYTPDNPAGWQVEAGNVGRHYYAWRYGADDE